MTIKKVEASPTEIYVSGYVAASLQQLLLVKKWFALYSTRNGFFLFRRG